MKLKSQRTDIIPLCLKELKSLIRSRANFETTSNYTLTGLELPDTYKEELTEIMERNPSAWLNNNKDYLFYTLWLMVERETQTIIGQFTFNGLPNSNGEVEVFFSVEEHHRQKGYANEVMLKILEWGEVSNLFRVVLIEADFDNKAAMASLKKLGFKRPQIDDEEEETKSTKFYKVICHTEIDESEFDFDSFKDGCD